MTDAFPDSLICPTGYSIIRRDRSSASKSKGGGVLCLYKSSLNVLNKSRSKDSDIESLVVELLPGSLRTSPIRFCCIYLPPFQSTNIIEVRKCCRLMKSLLQNGPVIFVGDFNLPGIDWTSLSSPNKVEEHFANFCTEESLDQHVTDPTYHGTRDSLIDLVLSNQHASDLIVSTSVSAPLSSTCDHDIIKIKLSVELASGIISKPDYFFKSADFQAIQSEMHNIEWNSVLNFKDYNLQQSYDRFLEVAHSVIDRHVPKRLYKHSFTVPRHIKKTAKLKLKLYHKKKKNPDLKRDYQKAARTYEMQIKKWFSEIEAKICHNRNRNDFYKYANRKLRLKATLPPILNDSGVILNDDFEKASFFNQKFQSVFECDDNIPLNLPDKTLAYLDNITISSDDIKYAIQNLNSKTSKTPDDIPSIFIKKVGPSLIDMLRQLFQESLNTGTLPKQWQTALVTPIHKKGSKEDVLNYRPVSLTSAICRLLETIIKVHILEHLYKNNLISTSQHGFLPGRSTTTQLLLSLNTIMKNFENKENTDIIFTDFSKAFDKVCHNKLIEILSSYGIKGPLLQWIRNFLQHRTQSVYIGSEVSLPLEVSSGVPQGSVLGPLLFLLYVQDLESTCHPGCIVSLFADDCKFISTERQALQFSLNNMELFVANRQMKLSSHKCLHLPITREEASNDFYLEGNLVRKTQSARDLGVIITSDLKWKAQVNAIVRKAFHACHKILYCFTTNDKDTLLHAYKVFIRPILEHNSVIWSPFQIGDRDKIESVQGFYTKKLLQRLGISSHDYQHRLDILKLESLEFRRIYFDMILVYKILNGYVDIDLNELFTFNPREYNLRGHGQTLKKPNYLLDITRNYFSVRSVRIWNALPNEIVSSTTLSLFKSRLRNVDLLKLKRTSLR